MRSPATAYAEWTETGGARQGRRRRRATNLNPQRKRKETLVVEAMATGRSSLIAGGYQLPSERLEGVVADEVELRRASHCCRPAAVCRRRTPSGGCPCHFVAVVSTPPRRGKSLRKPQLLGRTTFPIKKPNI